VATLSLREREERASEKGDREQERKRKRAPVMTQGDKWSHRKNNTSYPAVP